MPGPILQPHSSERYWILLLCSTFEFYHHLGLYQMRPTFIVICTSSFWFSIFTPHHAFISMKTCWISSPSGITARVKFTPKYPTFWQKKKKMSIQFSVPSFYAMLWALIGSIFSLHRLNPECVVSTRISVASSICCVSAACRPRPLLLHRR